MLLQSFAEAHQMMMILAVTWYWIVAGIAIPAAIIGWMRAHRRQLRGRIKRHSTAVHE